MSKIKYRVCDICGNRIPGFELDITGIAKRYINGCRIWNKLFNSLDICDDCIGKIKRLSIDKKEITTANKYRINPNKALVVIITITAIIAMINEYIAMDKLFVIDLRNFRFIIEISFIFYSSFSALEKQNPLMK